MRDIIGKLFSDEGRDEVPPGFMFFLFAIFCVAMAALAVGIAIGYAIFG